MEWVLTAGGAASAMLRHVARYVAIAMVVLGVAAVAGGLWLR